MQAFRPSTLSYMAKISSFPVTGARSISYKSNLNGIQMFPSQMTNFKSNPVMKSLVSVRRNITVVNTTTEELAEKKARLTRPISPHVTIYKFPIPAWASIATRFTGLGLTVGLYSAGLITMWKSAHTLEYTIESIKVAAPALVPLLKFFVAFPLCYHGLSGLRHLYWDYTTNGIDTKSVEQTSIYLLAATLVLTLGFTVYTI